MATDAAASAAANTASLKLALTGGRDDPVSDPGAADSVEGEDVRRPRVGAAPRREAPTGSARRRAACG